MAAEQDVDQQVLAQFFPGSMPGTLVEDGAAHPEFLSISRSFRDLGWKVVAIEPNPAFCEEHKKLGYDVLQYACSNRDADDVDFFVVDSLSADYLGGKVSYESFSSLGIDGSFAELQKTVETQTKTIKVKVRRLESILREHEPALETIDLLAVDVEGWEIPVVEGANLAKYSPKVVILENLFKDVKYKEAMTAQGYSLWKTLEPNEVYVRDDIVASDKPKGLFQRLFNR